MIKLTRTLGSLTGFLFLMITLFSCKKQIIESLDPSRVKDFEEYKNGPQLMDISYSQFSSKVNKAGLGMLKKQFESKNNRDKLMSINLPETYKGFALDIENIKMVTRDGHISYVFPVKLSSPHSVSFQNLTIDQSTDKTIAFVSTYTPSKQWIKNFKNKIPQAFEGEIKIIRINIDEDLSVVSPNAKSSSLSVNKLATIDVPSKTSMMLVCTEFFTYNFVGYPCNSNDSHMPWDACEWAGHLEAQDIDW